MANILKKILLSILLIVLIGMVFYFVRYQMNNTPHVEIPNDAVAALNINIRNIEKHIVDDIIMHPLGYLWNKTENNQTNIDTTEVTKPEQIEEPQNVSLRNIIDLPKNIVFYTLDKNQTSWISSPFKIKDRGLLIDFCQKHGLIESPLDVSSSLHSTGDIHVLIQDQMARVLYCHNPQKTIAKLLPNSDKTIEINDILNHKLSNAEHDISYASAKGQYLDLDFEEDEISLSGKIMFSFLNSITQMNNTKSIIQFALGLDTFELKNVLSQVNTRSFEEFTKLNVDTLIQKCTGQIAFNLMNFENQNDTVVSYEYDDDFNKVEVQSIVPSIKPNFVLDISTTEDMSMYLSNKKAIVLDQQDTILALLPLVRTICSSNNNHLLLTSNESKPEWVQQLTGNKLMLSFDIQSYITTTQGTKYDLTYLYPFTDLQLEINRNDQLSIKLGTNNGRHSLVGITKGYLRQ